MDTDDWTIVKIDRDEAAAIMLAFVTAQSEGRLESDSARVAIKLIQRFGREIIDDMNRGWFLNDLAQDGFNAGC
jgi:hypothetical protein